MFNGSTKQEDWSINTMRSPREFRCTQRRQLQADGRSITEAVDDVYLNSSENLRSPREFRCTQRRLARVEHG